MIETVQSKQIISSSIKQSSITGLDLGNPDLLRDTGLELELELGPDVELINAYLESAPELLMLSFSEFFPALLPDSDLE